MSFCLDTALDILLKVQHATFRPAAAEFSMAFKDVLIAKHDGVLVHAEPHYLFTGWRGPSEMFGALSKGQRIMGRLLPAYRGPDPGDSWEKVADIEFANTFVMQDATTDLAKPVHEHYVLVVRAEDVHLSDEPNPAARNFFPHLFSDDGPER